MKKVITFLFAVLVAYWLVQFFIFQLKETIRVTIREESELQEKKWNVFLMP